MADEKLRIILDAFYRGKGEVQKAQNDLKNIGKFSDATKRDLMKMGAVGGVALGGLAIAAKLTFDSMNRGAAIELAASKFDKLTTSINTTSDALLKDMKGASRRMVAEADLVAGANELMSGKLARTHDEVVRLSTVSTQLGWDMGVLAQTINNQSVLRLDNLGVAAEDVIPKFEALKAAGMDVKAAFTEALVSAGEAKLALVGSEADTTAGKIKQMTAMFKEAQDAFDQGVAIGMSGSIAELAGQINIAAESTRALGEAWGSLVGQIVTGVGGSIAVQQKLNTLIEKNVMTTEEANRIMFLYKKGAISTEQALQGLIDAENTLVVATSSAGTEVIELKDKIYIMGQTGVAAASDIYVLARALDAAFAASDRALAAQNFAMLGATPNTIPNALIPNKIGYAATRMLDNIGKSGGKAAQGVDELSGSFGGLSSAVDDVAKLEEEMRALASATGDYFMEARRAKDFNPFESLLEAADKYGANALQLANIGVAGGLFDEGQAQEYLKRTAMMHRADTLARAVAAGALSEADAVNMLGGLKGQLEGGLDVVDEFFADINATEITPELLLNTDNMWNDYVFMKTQIEKNPPVVIVQVKNAVAAANADNIRGPIE